MMERKDIPDMALKAGGYIEVRADVDGMTKSFIVAADVFEFGPDGNTLRLSGTVQAQGAARHSDQRIQTQKDAIERLLIMLERHHTLDVHINGCATCKTGRFTEEAKTDE